MAQRIRPVPPPADFDESQRSLWHRAQRQLRAQQTWQDTDAALLESYVRTIAAARAGRAAAADEPFVTGSAGQPVAHPGLRLAADAERDACRYATALLLTPEARKRRGVGPTIEGDEDLPFLEAVA